MRTTCFLYWLISLSWSHRYFNRDLPKTQAWLNARDPRWKGSRFYPETLGFKASKAVSLLHLASKSPLCLP